MEYAGYMIEGDGTYGMKLIKTIGRGSLPLELRGNFSSTREARKAIDLCKTKKEKVDGEDNNSD
jgi:hypothetical protein